MHPNGPEALRTVQASLATYVLPEVRSAYARTELMAILALLGIVAGDWDAAAQRLVADNAALRSLAARGAHALDGDRAHETVAVELRSLAESEDGSLLLSDLAAANDALQAALSRLAPILEASADGARRELRAALIDHLRADAGARSRHLMGPRADG
jgi:hypothetical protein